MIRGKVAECEDGTGKEEGVRRSAGRAGTGEEGTVPRLWC
jgi:hypothetical protein